MHTVNRPFGPASHCVDFFKSENTSIGRDNVPDLEKYDIPRDQICCMYISPPPIPQNLGPWRVRFGLQWSLIILQNKLCSKARYEACSH
uniref:AHA7 n=1 Tax=Arundo donax TaxID=35708 RepID=A0A0A9CQ10_ARUDO